MDRQDARPTYRLRFVIVIATVALVFLMLILVQLLGLVQVGLPRSNWDWVEVVILGALTVAAMSEGWWRVRHHFPLFPRRPGDQ